VRKFNIYVALMILFCTGPATAVNETAVTVATVRAALPPPLLNTITSVSHASQAQSPSTTFYASQKNASSTEAVVTLNNPVISGNLSKFSLWVHMSINSV